VSEVRETEEGGHGVRRECPPPGKHRFAPAKPIYEVTGRLSRVFKAVNRERPKKRENPPLFARFGRRGSGEAAKRRRARSPKQPFSERARRHPPPISIPPFLARALGGGFGGGKPKPAAKQSCRAKPPSDAASNRKPEPREQGGNRKPTEHDHLPSSLQHRVGEAVGRQGVFFLNPLPCGDIIPALHTDRGYLDTEEALSYTIQWNDTPGTAYEILAGALRCSATFRTAGKA